MTKEKYRKLRKKRLKEREERLRRERARIRTQRETMRKMRMRKWADLGKKRKIVEGRLQKKARKTIEAIQTALEEVEEKTEISLYVPETAKKIGEMMTNAKDSFDLANYRKAIKISHQIKGLVEKAGLEAARKAKEKEDLRRKKGKYLYCVISSNEEKSFGNIGMDNSEVYTIPYKDLAAVVSDSSMKEVELTEDNVRKHQTVIRQAMEKHTVVPAEFNTRIKNEAILRRLLRKAYKPARESLKLVDNMVELGVKGIINDEEALAQTDTRKECLSDILESLTSVAKQAITDDLFSDRLILNTSFLVKKEDIATFSDEVTKLQKEYPMLKLLYTGPWAPYNFVYIKIGTKGMEIGKN